MSLIGITQNIIPCEYFQMRIIKFLIRKTLPSFIVQESMHKLDPCTRWRHSFLMKSMHSMGFNSRALWLTDLYCILYLTHTDCWDRSVLTCDIYCYNCVHLHVCTGAFRQFKANSIHTEYYASQLFQEFVSLEWLVWWRITREAEPRVWCEIAQATWVIQSLGTLD